MLNISHNKIEGKFNTKRYVSFKGFKGTSSVKVLTRMMVGAFAVLLILMFLPWTQNVITKGNVTTLRPDQRPQQVNALIDGQVQKWYVKEGQRVNMGDTLVQLKEIKPEYLDPSLVSRAEQQIKAKEAKVGAYMDKIRAYDLQIDALLNTKRLKLKQANNYLKQANLKIVSDSITYELTKQEADIAEKQLVRAEKLLDQGLKSLTEVESRRVKARETMTKMVDAENKLLASKNQRINALVELSAVENDYANKIAKAESDKFAALSEMYETEGEVTKLQTQYANYSLRSGQYYVLAPQNGFVTKTTKAGIGEAVKAGGSLLTIVPTTYDLAVAMYVEPVDLPLIEQDQHVRIVFDGWPSVAFSGWPGLNYGTFGGEVVAIDNNISENGKYRILVSPSKNEPWPDAIRVGAGAKGFALLKNVPIWYELWRQLNGFPPDYYKASEENEKVEKE